MGGSTSPGNQVQKYTWSAGTFSATPTLPLNGSNFGNGCESSTHAYNISGSGQYAVQKISFSDDTTSSIPISSSGNQPGYVYMAMLGDTSQTYMCGGNASDFGDLIEGLNAPCGLSSTARTICAGGSAYSNNYRNTISYPSLGYLLAKPH